MNSSARTIGVVTVGRSDYGGYIPILRRLQAEPRVEFYLLVSGSHLSPEFGRTILTIEADGFPIGERVEMLLSSDSPEGIAKSIGLGVLGFAQSYARRRPDLLVVFGDRFETYAAALAALPFNIPIAHIHGGEITLGAIDDALRHSLTKLSHLHFVATREYASRVTQLGEEPWRVVVSGAPSLDNIKAITLSSAADLSTRYGFPVDPPPILVTFHPVTLEPGQVESQMRELLEGLCSTRHPLVFTKPNADTGGRRVAALINEFVGAQPRAWCVDNFGMHDYFSMMNIAAAMVGNSSSGIIEAPSFGLPVVNIGTRQAGRQRAVNVIDVAPDRNAIASAVERVTTPGFRRQLAGMRNPYGDGRAADVIVERLTTIGLDDRLSQKRFFDLDLSGAALPDS